MTPPQALQHHPPPGRRSHGDSIVGNHSGASECHGGGNRATRAMVEEMKGGQTSGVAGGLSDSAPTASSSGGGETPNMAVTLAVGDAIASAASAVTGTFTSSVVPIDLHLSDKVKAQIWQDEYIDFSQLLPTNNQNDPMALGVQSQNSCNEVVMMPNRQKKTLSFQEWSSAWNIYSGIYLAKPNPQEGLCTALAKHFDVVQGLSRNNTGWQFYDHNFRLMVAKGLAQWGSVHAELLVEAKLLLTSPALTGKRTSNNHIPHGSCIRFHRTGHWRFQDDCKWSHTCVNCVCVCVGGGGGGGGGMLPYLAASATESIPVPFVANHHRGQQEQTKTNPAEMKQTTPPPTTTKVSSPNCHKLPTPINHRNLKKWLQGYDTAEQSFLINGFQNGFDIGFQQSVSNISVPNHSSANYHPGIVNDYITAELRANRIEGPHTEIPFPTFQISPLGVVPKKTPGNFVLYMICQSRNHYQLIRASPEQPPTCNMHLSKTQCVW